jgi:hypothetical protein
VIGLEGFYPAEAYHQDDAARRPNDRDIVMVDNPKVDAWHKYRAEVWTD